MTDTMTDTLYDRIGGSAAVNAAVDIFYKKVMAIAGSTHDDVLGL